MDVAVNCVPALFRGELPASTRDRKGCRVRSELRSDCFGSVAILLPQLVFRGALGVRDIDVDLIKERLSYAVPEGGQLPVSTRKYEWRFQDLYGNRRGRWLYRLASLGMANPEAAWTDVFGEEVHQSSFFAGYDFAVCAVADRTGSTLYRVEPPGKAIPLFHQSQPLELRGLSGDERHLLVQSGGNGNWYRPELLVLDGTGKLCARIGGAFGVAGCWEGAWSPVAGDDRIVFCHEAAGYFRPAIWAPFRGDLVDLRIPLDGEIYPMWDRTGTQLILKRCRHGRSDVHRFFLESKKLETLQPCDGSVFRVHTDLDNQVVGLWASNDRHVRAFRERERSERNDFRPSRPLNPWHFRFVEEVPCFIAGTSAKDEQVWTIFDGYGMPGYHHTDGYNWKIHPLVDHGFQIVLVNTRGCGGFGREWREATLGKVGFTELEDMRKVRDALVREGKVDPERTIIMGDSWGGYMALLAMGTQSELWKICVAGEPVTDFSRLGQEACPIQWPRTRALIQGGPMERPDEYRKTSAVSHVDTVKGPVLMMVGCHDELCPPSQSLLFAEAVRKRGGVAEVDVFEGAHGPATREERLRVCLRMLSFLIEHCRAFDAKGTGQHQAGA